MSSEPMTAAEQEKRRVAVTSVAAAVFLTALKLVVGVSTNSLGILSEAAHSALDLVAAFVTFLAVRVSDRPADAEHRYGHGKVENLSALFETLLLLATCAWIIYESIERLAFRPVAVEATFWGFAVMSVSIVVDYSRSRALIRVARKYNSQALEADALHFRTDIWSSCVVLAGLAGVRMATYLPEHADVLMRADAVAALVVAMIVIGVSVQLGGRTIHGLLDTAPKGLSERIQAAVEALPGVGDCHHIRVRTSGARVFVDVHVLVDGRQSLDDAHRITEHVEAAIVRLEPNADVTVHPEPTNRDSPS